MLGVPADGDGAARARYHYAGHAGTAQAGQGAARREHVRAMQLLCRLAVARDFTGGEECTVTAGRAPSNGLGVEHVHRLHG